MRRLLSACIAASLTTAVAAQDAAPVVEQQATGSQFASNALKVGTLESLTDAFMQKMLTFHVTGKISQEGANTTNVVQFDGDLASVKQHFDGQQRVENSAALGSVDLLGMLSQSGANTANTSQSRTLNYADQLLDQHGLQQVLNTAEIAILYGSVEQSGINIANSAVAELAIGTASQQIRPGAVQRVDNRLELAAMSAIASAVSQRGENFGNIMVSDEVDQVTRNFAGDQIVHNVVHLGEGTPGTIEQYGINVANMITSSKIGSLSQTSTGKQDVINEVFDAQNTLLTGGNITQSSDNYVNLIVLTAPADGGSNAIISVDQSANYPQDASGNGAHSQTGNALTVNR